MRVQWLSSAALLALIAAPGVFAQQVSGNEPFAVKVSGSSQAGLQFVQPSNEAKDGRSLNTMQLVNKTRINVNADAMVNNIGFGVGTTLELSNGGVNNDGINNFVYVSPMGIGKITLGQTPYNADWGGFDGSMTWGTASFVSFSPDYGWGARGTGFAKGISGSADMLDGADVGQGGPKVSYSTPDLMGLSAIVAFTPSTDNKGWGGDLGKDNGGFNNMIEAGASYTTPDLGGVKVNVAGGFVTASADTVGKGEAGVENLSAFQGHLQVTGYGVMAQFAYVNDGKSNQVKGAGGKEATGMSGSLAYAMGPVQVGVYYGMSSNSTKTGGDTTTSYVTKAVTTGTGDTAKTTYTTTEVDTTSKVTYANNDYTAMGVGASYNVAKGAQVFAGYETFSEKPTKGATQKAGAATVGMAVSF